MKRVFLVTMACMGLLVGALYVNSSAEDCVKCFSNMEPYQGHGPASQLPTTVCGNCAGDNRRVIVLRLDANWGSNPPSNLVTAMQNSVNTYNSMRECSCSGSTCDSTGQPYRTGYYLVFAQPGQLTGVPTDIRVEMSTVSDPNHPDYLASCDTNNNPGNANRQNEIALHYRYQQNIDGLTNIDMENAIRHEIAHLLGLDNASPGCANTVMVGAASNGAPQGALTCQDIKRINEHFASRSNCTGNANSAKTLESEATPTPTPTPTPEECIGLGYPCDGSVECCDPMENWCNGYTGACDNCPGQLYNGICTETPIIIDVAGNDFRLTSPDNGIDFDFKGDGRTWRVSWTEPTGDDVWLALDRNGNGTIDDGSELFGNHSPQPTPPAGQVRNGFLGLAEHDKPTNGGNGDGVISAADSVYGNLRGWRDANQNGISEPSELFHLSALGINTIDLNYKLSERTDQYGNRFRYRARVGNKWAYDVLLPVR